MTVYASEDQISAARAYEALHVPALFQQWPSRLLDRVSLQPRDRVLDVACGTGVLAREAARYLDSSGSVAGIDLDPGMLTIAAERDPTVEWRLGRAESLPFPDASFDRVASQFGLMFFTDRAKALREMLRVLDDDGVLGVAVWDRLENSAAYGKLVELVNSMVGEQAADALRAPFALGDTQQLASRERPAGSAVE